MKIVSTKDNLQILHEDKFFVFHSNCEILINGVKSNTPVWEFVDLKSNIKESGKMSGETPLMDLRIADLTLFLEKNIGY